MVQNKCVNIIYYTDFHTVHISTLQNLDQNYLAAAIIIQVTIDQSTGVLSFSIAAGSFGSSHTNPLYITLTNTTSQPIVPSRHQVIFRHRSAVIFYATTAAVKTYITTVKNEQIRIWGLSFRVIDLILKLILRRNLSCDDIVGRCRSILE